MNETKQATDRELAQAVRDAYRELRGAIRQAQEAGLQVMLMEKLDRLHDPLTIHIARPL